MNPVLAKALKKGAQGAMKKAIKYIRDDQRKTYGLDEIVSFDIEAKGAGGHPAFKTQDGSLEFTPLDADHFRVVCYPFPSFARLWNGPDIIRDDDLAAMAASLVHDLWWIHADEIAGYWGRDRVAVLHFGNELLNCIWLVFEPKSRMARIAYGVCEWAAPWYHKVKKLVGLGCLTALLAAGSGCGLLNAPEGWRVVSAEGTNAIARAMQPVSTASVQSGAAGAAAASRDKAEAFIGEALAESGGARARQEINAPSEKPATDAVDFASLRWEYGGFRGGNATLAGCRIKDLKVSSGGLSYAWEKGGCEDLDRACTHDNAVCTCALFCRIDGRWIGGKFDHISTDRTTRDFENIRNGYGGWDPSMLSRADAFAFVIEDDGGRRRANVITCGR